jgi:TetR/AcrR family transcriptional repressor of nem operon
VNPPPATNTREQLLEAAGDLLQRMGFNAFSFRTLGEVIGISSASIHYHFPAKADLGLALIDWFRAKQEPDIIALCQRCPNIRDRFAGLAALIAEETCVQGKSCPINVFLSEYAQLPEVLQTAVLSWVEDIVTSLATWLELGRQAGELQFPGDAKIQARLVWSVIEHGTQMARTNPKQPFLPLMQQLISTMTPTP